MAKSVEVLGIALETYTVRENMQFLEEYVTNDQLNIVCAVSSYTLMAASNNDELAEFIAGADLRMISDPVIFEVVEDKFEQQYTQLKKQELEEQFVKCLMRKKKKVFYICDTQEQVRKFENYIQENYPGLEGIGTCADGIEEEKVEHIINEINSADVDVLLLNFHSPRQEMFIKNNKHLLHVKLCICMGDGIKLRYPIGIRISKLKGMLDQTLFKRKVMKYNSENMEI